jgi:aldose 1-epimerase
VIELVAGSARLGIDLERGGRLSSLRIGERELLVGPPDAEDRSIEWGSFLMAPWVGRLEHGIFEFDGRRHVMPATLGPHAIHGVVFDRAWTATRVDGDIAELTCDLGPAGWPFGGVARQRFRLERGTVHIEAEVEAERRMPAALGWHPWFRRDAPGPRLRVDADEVLQTRAMIPTGQRVPVRGMTDLRPGRLIAGRHVDHAYIDARSPAVATFADLELRIGFEAPVNSLVVYTPPHAFCVEPQTAWPNALAGGEADAPRTGLRILEPGGILRASMRIEWSPAEPAR